MKINVLDEQAIHVESNESDWKIEFEVEKRGQRSIVLSNLFRLHSMVVECWQLFISPSGQAEIVV